MKRRNYGLLKSTILPPPRFVRPQLAMTAKKPPVGEAWVHEFKFDGFRGLIRVDEVEVEAGARVRRKKEVRILSRDNKNMTEAFAILAEQITGLRKVRNAMFDGEIVALDRAGKISLAALQHAQGRLGDKSTPTYVAFDLLFLNGVDLTGRPFHERKAILEKILPKPEPSTRLVYSQHFTEAAEKVLKAACDHGMEGIISKKLDAPYLPGRRSKSWQKYKCAWE